MIDYIIEQKLFFNFYLRTHLLLLPLSNTDSVSAKEGWLSVTDDSVRSQSVLLSSHRAAPGRIKSRVSSITDH